MSGAGCSCGHRRAAPILGAVLSLAFATLTGLASAATPLEEGAQLLADFRPGEALPRLEAAQGEGPYGYEDYARLWELLATAHAYLGHTEEATRAFEFLLALDPGRAISYELSPKATFLFEKARQLAAQRAAPAIDVHWGSGPQVGLEIPLEIEVVADPQGNLHNATLYCRGPGQAEATPHALVLAPPGARQRLRLPPVYAEGPVTLRLHLVARDQKGNEVHRWYSADRPREVSLLYEPPTPWYGTWWVWTAVAGVVVAGAIGTAVALSHEPSTTAQVNFGWAP